MMNRLIHLIDSVIPKPRALAGGTRDLAWELLIILDSPRFFVPLPPGETI